MIIPFNTDMVKLTSPYGNRILNGAVQNHTGYDLVGVGSYDVTAAEGGTVIRSRIVNDRTNLTWQWGNYVCVQTAGGQYHYYCHLASRAVTEGQTVKAGDKLGVMGSTGYSFGTHLHFEVREKDGRTTVSPETVLGIPNVPGTYAVQNLELALETLVRHGIIQSPDYWRLQAPQVTYLTELLIRVAEALK